MPLASVFIGSLSNETPFNLCGIIQVTYSFRLGNRPIEQFAMVSKGADTQDVCSWIG